MFRHPNPLTTTTTTTDDAIAEAINTITSNVEEMRALKAATQLLIEDKANNVQENDAPDQ